MKYESSLPEQTELNLGMRLLHLPWVTRDGGCKNGIATDPKFKEMKASAHNLFSSIGEVNGDRSNYRFSQWNGVQGATYGQCEMQIDFKARKAMPPERSRGVVVRAQLYISERYDIKLSSADRRLFEVWNNTYAHQAWECKRNKYIETWQGNNNPFISRSCALK
ncbi:endonuclease [Vibrio aestuarianus]|uniref:endonuclease n=1 Tax=Vibrio aestuarianus TaxID=28171 RepID=UPI00237D312E|nr:endonuclease [Vibrio aestuarianus]MDE1210189.1 endonuclease [Vibrio aestuarianus]MDE1220657.1 endonuclease [Vibrio aestuarianus]MDE1251685.1 endonuclease [Vibrio aestuarianus]MDE1316674.1 endonuclease [Vibrio aestuarianus]MDE1340509.1 endonuclease [Vibrio aestuarianus]